MIEVIQAGQYTTIQDLGRFGYRAMGVPVSGPMDRYSSRLANELLGNDANAPILEMTLTGATLLFLESTTIVITGAKCLVYGTKEEIENNQEIRIEANTQLKFGAITSGNFIYLAVRGGFISDNVLGSVSYSKGITEEIRIQKGQLLAFNKSENQVVARGAKFKSTGLKTNDIIQVEKGPEYHLLSDAVKQGLIESLFSISMQSNRMGYRLEGDHNVGANEIITSPVQPGTVQLTPSGQLVVLMRDAQTTGGYSRVLQLTPSSINQLAQTHFGEHFRFQLID